ncbi:hypothetical protein V5O48_004380 [Marasmius crinis-equi]|uniref:Uncharacterized protein n=1 Tax=Marasmius crinis-equi TaxID=585013 RepID=A0ABR3FQH6_9AGAR
MDDSSELPEDYDYLLSVNWIVICPLATLSDSMSYYLGLAYASWPEVKRTIDAYTSLASSHSSRLDQLWSLFRRFWWSSKLLSHSMRSRLESLMSFWDTSSTTDLKQGYSE